MSAWKEAPEPPPPSLPRLALALARMLPMAVVIYGLLAVLVLVRLAESPFRARPVSPLIVQAACRASLLILGLPISVEGKPMRHPGAIVANHASWLDIFTLNAAARVFFVSKAEVSRWPGIGIVARGTGTLFIERRPSHARQQQALFERRLLRGDRLLFFPEGTSTDSRRVLAFKSTLFAAFFAPALKETLWIQPVSVIYHAPGGADPRFYGWWGDMTFGPHFLSVLGARPQGRVEILFHDPVRVADFSDRKALARHCEETVRKAHAARLDPAAA